jgi:ribonuclease P protein component
MLTKKFKLPLADFSRTKNHKNVSCRSFSIKIYRNLLPHPRLGIIVSAKVMPRAVSRNKLKRRISYLLFPMLKNSVASVDLVFLPKKQIKDKSFKDLKSEIQTIKNQLFI